MASASRFDPSARLDGVSVAALARSRVACANSSASDPPGARSRRAQAAPGAAFPRRRPPTPAPARPPAAPVTPPAATPSPPARSPPAAGDVRNSHSCFAWNVEATPARSTRPSPRLLSLPAPLKARRVASPPRRSSLPRSPQPCPLAHSGLDSQEWPVLLRSHLPRLSCIQWRPRGLPSWEPPASSGGCRCWRPLPRAWSPSS